VFWSEACAHAHVHCAVINVYTIVSAATCTVLFLVAQRKCIVRNAAPRVHPSCLLTSRLCVLTLVSAAYNYYNFLAMCRLILFKLLNSGFISQIDGCLSTGKEANVYYAAGKVNEGKEYAVKVHWNFFGNFLQELSSGFFFKNFLSYAHIFVLVASV
jgi:hypothetical protein